MALLPPPRKGLRHLIYAVEGQGDTGAVAEGPEGRPGGVCPIGAGVRIPSRQGSTTGNTRLELA